MASSAEFYRKNPESRRKKGLYDKKNNAKKHSKLYRARLNKINRDNPKSVKGDGLDASHTKSGIRLKSQSKNRGSSKDQPGDKRARGEK